MKRMVEKIALALALVLALAPAIPKPYNKVAGTVVRAPIKF
jgi:hypothetical protein